MQLTTDRLILREFVEEDWQAVLVYQQNPRYFRYYAQDAQTEQGAREFIKMFLDQQAGKPRTKFQLAVTHKENGQLIGNCGIRLKTLDAIEGDIGYELNPEYWGHGYASEAAKAIVHYGFTELHLHRIWSWCIADNVGSYRVMEKVGMRREGHLRQNEFYKGRYWDTLIYAILENEWQMLYQGNKTS